MQTCVLLTYVSGFKLLEPVLCGWLVKVFGGGGGGGLAGCVIVSWLRLDVLLPKGARLWGNANTMQVVSTQAGG